MNADKTRLVRFKRPSISGDDPGGQAGTFDFLGFTLHWGKSRRGFQVVMLRTARKRFTRVLQAFKEWGRENRHLPLKEQQRQLNEKLRGHDAFYGVAFNYRMLQRLRWEIHRLWRRWLARCNRKGARNWDQFHALRRVFPLLPPRIIHSCL